MAKVVIYTKHGCPYCAAAKEEYRRKGSFTEINVQDQPGKLQEMLRLSGGRRQVPVIVVDGEVSVGHGGS
jgi:glutaredoxin 3